MSIMSNETQLRIIENLRNISEHSFYSESVQSAIDEFKNINTLKELIDKATVNYHAEIKNVFNVHVKKDVEKYRMFLTRVDGLENTFSFDVDYI